MGHPDKIADQISDAVLDTLIAEDPNCRVACETLVTTGMAIVAGEISTTAYAHIPQVVRDTIRDIGYTDASMGFDYHTCAVLTSIDRQSPDIARGVNDKEGHEQGAGDQGIMFGYACRETNDFIAGDESYMPLPIWLAHRLVERLAEARQTGELKWLRPDSKSQVTIEYEKERALRVHAVVLATQHDESVIDPRTDCISEDAKHELIERVIRPVLPDALFGNDIIYHINPTGRFVIGGPQGDCGLTGRKIVVDTYGGRGGHGGGAFSGKDPSKVDRSASYMARYIAKNIVAADLAERCEVQLSYAIGVAEPLSIVVYTDGTSRVSEDLLVQLIREYFPLRPRGIIEYLDLLRPIYLETARHGHFGRNLPIFTWEKTDQAETLRKAAGL
jgi:S-adenosylmethionine synthetase